MTHGHAENQELEGYQVTEALEALNGMLAGLQNEGIGGRQDGVDITGNEEVNFPSYLYIKATAPLTIKLPKMANDGFLVSFIDINGSFAASNVTVDPQGVKIAGGLSLVLNINNTNDRYMYRADLGEWVKFSTLTINDNLPYPVDFDEALSSMLSIRTSAENADDIPQTAVLLAQNGLRRLQQRYSIRESRYDASLLRPPSSHPLGYRTNRGFY